jgi:hypothetical protein
LRLFPSYPNSFSTGMVELFSSTSNNQPHRALSSHHQQPNPTSNALPTRPIPPQFTMAKDRSVSKDKKEKKDKKDKKEKKSKDIISPVEDDTTKVSKSSKKEKKDKKAPKTEGDAAEALLEALVKNDEETKSGEGTSRGTVASAIISEVTKAQGPLSDLLVPFAKPLADEKLSKKVLKTVKKGSFSYPAIIQLQFFPSPLFHILPFLPSWSMQ